MSGGRRVRWRPAREDAVDAAAAVLLTVLPVLTLHDTYDGAGFLVVATIGAVLGAVIALLCHAARLPLLLVPPVLALGYLLVGGAVALRADPAAGWLPGPGTVGELVRVGVRGWAQLLTTLPPVDGAGPLLALVLLLGLAGAGLATSLALRSRAVAAPLPAVAATLVLAVLVGTGQPGTVSAVGVGTGAGLLGWATLRFRRRTVATAIGRGSRAVTAGVVLAVAVAGVAVAAPALPGTGTGDRLVLRTHVTPPLDLSAFPSPLIGFRRFRPASQQLADRTLFTVRGLPAGYRLRIATLDAYDGLVWGVRNDAAAPAVDDVTGRQVDTFQRVGSRVAVAARGRDVRLRVRVGANYAAGVDTNGWLPGAGAMRSLTFGGRHADGHRADVRYNLATRTVIVPDRLRSGDTYELHTVLDDAAKRTAPLPATAQPGGRFAVDPGRYAVVQPTVSRITAQISSGRWDQLRAVAKELRTQGAYTDGGTGEAQFLPGHSTGRLRAFLAAPQYAGNDEQYAAVFALVANDLGFPARVVVGATPSGGVVRGRDVHAWVELLLRGRGWTTVGTDEFTPPQTQRPQPQRVQQPQNSAASVVPPPNAVRPPSGLDLLSQDGSNGARRGERPGAGAGGWQLPGFVVAALRWGGPPVGVVLAVVVAIVGAKAWRRRRRRTGGTSGLQVASGWRELIDQARDLGAVVTTDMTRREQAGALDGYGLAPFAERADRALFGGQQVGEAFTADYWSDVRRLRREMLLGVGRRRRWRARLSLRSFRPLPRA